MHQHIPISRPLQSQERRDLRIVCGCGAVCKHEGERHSVAVWDGAERDRPVCSI